MKRGYLFGIVFVFLLIYFTNFVYADVAPGPNEHSVSICSKVTNLNEFPDVAIIGNIFQVMGGGGYSNYIVQPDQCLDKGYKFNSLSIYAVNRSYLEGKNITNMNLSLDNNFLKSDIHVEIGSGSVENTNPLKSENISYKIAGFSGNKLIIYEAQTIDSYNNGQTDSINNSLPPQISDLRQTIKVSDIPPIPPIPTPTPTPTPTPVKKGFWDSIGCFFIKLFGGKC